MNKTDGEKVLREREGERERERERERRAWGTVRARG